MSTDEQTGRGGSGQPDEAELRAALEEQMRRLTVEDLLVQSTVSLINLAGRRLGLGPDGAADRDLEQVRDAVDAVTGLLPILERRGGEDLRPLRDAVAQLQLEYARLARAEPGTAPGGDGGSGGGPDRSPPTGAGEQPPPERPASSGRLWVPGQP